MHRTHSRKNVTVDGRRTSLCLETEVWEALGDICSREGLNLHQLCSLIDERRRGSSRTSAVRAFTLTYFRVAATETGHALVGHGPGAAEPPKDRRPGRRLDMDTRQRLLSTPYFERRGQGDRRRSPQAANAPERRVRGERRRLRAGASVPARLPV